MLKVIAAQIGLGVAVAAVLWGTSGNVAGYSALIGSAVSILPNGFLALRLSAPRRDPGAKSLLRAAYIGEAGKVALTVLLFGIVFVTVRPLAAAPFFAGFIVATLAPLAGHWLLGKSDNKEEAVIKDGE